MNKRGFTLIELLAVIVILAIIALIATPIVLNMIESARRSAAKSAALGYIEAIEYDNEFAELEQDGYTKITSGDVSTINNTLGNHIKGKKPTSGSVTVDSNGKVTNATLCMSGYTVTYENNDVSNVTKGCSGSSNNNTPATTTYYYQDSSDKKNQPASSWIYYIKEELEDVTASSDVYEFVDSSSMHSADYGLTFTTLEDCQSAVSYDPSGSCSVKYESGTNYSKRVQVQVCINVSTYGGEECFNSNEYTTSVNKMKNYFEYNEDTWNNYSGDSWKNPDETITCSFSSNDTGCGSIVGSSRFIVQPSTNGTIQIGQYVNNNINSCFITPIGAAGCFKYN